MSADGSVVVGSSRSGGDREAFRFTDALTEEYGLDLAGSTLLTATGISDDGTVIVGTGYGTGGADDTEAWRAVVPLP